MHVPTKARLAVAAVAASAVSMGVAAPSFASVAPHSAGTNSPATAAVGVKTAVTVTITNTNNPTKPNERAVTWSIPAGAVAPTGSWSLNFHDASGTSAKATVPAGTLTATHNFVLAAGITYDTFSVSVSASDKVTLNTWSGSSSVTIGTPAKGGAVAPTVSVAPGVAVAVGATITATAINGAVAAGGNLRYDFDFGDPLKTQNNTQVIVPGTDPAKTGVAQYAYTVAGTYTLKVTSTDGTNKAVSTPITITVGGGTTPPPTTGGPGVQRLSGGSRFETGIAVSQKAFPAPTKDVIIATGWKFPDALSGVPLAKKLNAPLLLVDSNDVTNNALVKNEIARLLATGGTLHVLGGTSAVPDAVVNAVLPAGVTIDRIWGASRFETSVQIAHKLGDPKNVVVARGDDGTNMTGFADALSAGPYAANVFGGTGGAAVLLSSNTTLDPAVKTYLQGATAIQAVGGPAATAVNGLANVQPAIQGHDRYETAAMVADKFVGVNAPKTAGVAYGQKFPDALTGAAFLAIGNGPLLLTDTDALPDYSKLRLATIGSALGTTGVISVFGGNLVVTENARTAVATASGGHLI